MQFPPVHWHEGLFLQPQHFQAWDRHWTERVSMGEMWQNPYAYGVAEIEINSAALAAGYFQLDKLKAKTPAGTLLELSVGQQSERRDVRPALHSTANATVEPQSQNSSRVNVFIGVPRLRLGDANVAQGEQNAGNRYSTELYDLPDEVDASSIQPVELRKVNAEVLLSGDDLEGYDTLQIARLRLSADGVSLELDDSYVPPLVDCRAWKGLQSQVLSPIADLLAQASEQAGRLIADSGRSIDVSSSQTSQRLMLLQVVNPAASAMRVMTKSHGIHPQTAYLQLAHVAGGLDIFHPERSVKETAAYDHDNLGPLFAQIKQRIVAALRVFETRPYIQKYFTGSEFGLRSKLDSIPEGRCNWFVGINKGRLPNDLLRDLLSAGNLDWKIGSAEQVEWMFKQRAPGIELQPVSEMPSQLPRSGEWAYFQVRQEGPAWQDVLDTGTIAIRFKESLIANLKELAGNRQIVVRYGKHNIPLQFALFAVPVQ